MRVPGASFGLAFLLTVLWNACLAQPPSRAAVRGKALVIANHSYTFGSPPVRAGALAVAAALRELRFEVTSIENAELRPMSDTLSTFFDNLSAQEPCIIYYSGYAIQFADDNFLLPSDFDPTTQKDLVLVAYHTRFLLSRFPAGHTGPKLVILEASWEDRTLVDRFGRGLAPLGQTPPNTLFVSAAAANSTATNLEVAGNMGTFTYCLLEALKKPGLTASDLFADVQQQVTKLSKGRQTPSATGAVAGLVIHHAVPRTSPGTMITNLRDRQDYVYIPAGKFRMGCVPASLADCKPEEKPQHEVRITQPFWMGRNEVEVEAYKKFARENRRKMPGAPSDYRNWNIPSLPMVSVGWADAQAYCQWAGGRLPTEAEWEYAARGKQEEAVFPYADLETSREKANFDGVKGNDSYLHAAPVRRFDPNAFGLFDMSGNVWEWVHDFFSADYYARSPASDPKGPPTGKEHVIRGGSWYSDASVHLRLSYRRGSGGAANHVGFRCVLPDSPEIRSRLHQ